MTGLEIGFKDIYSREAYNKMLMEMATRERLANSLRPSYLTRVLAHLGEWLISASGQGKPAADYILNSAAERGFC